MAQTNVLPIRQNAKTQPQTRRTTRATKALTLTLRRQSLAAAGIGVVACVVTGLSLHHLADGIMLVTKAPAWEAWSEGTGIDLGFVSMELATIAATTDKLRKQISRWTRPAIAISPFSCKTTVSCRIP